MSETSQGPGWWLASDGKWYPPEQHPTMGPPPPPPPAQGQTNSDREDLTSTGSFGDTNVMSPPSGWQPPSYPPQSWSPPLNNAVIDPVIGVALAPWWKRLLAIIIDGIIITLGMIFLILIIVVIVAAIVGHRHHTTTSSNNGGGVIAAFIIIWLVFSLPLSIYYSAMNGSKRGQTVGKMALSIAVRDATTGGKVGFWRAFGRFYMTTLFSVLLYVPYIIDSLAPLWDKRRQAWHDKIAHTVVVDLKP